MNAARMNSTVASPAVESASGAVRRSDSSRDHPRVSRRAHPRRSPAAAESTTAVNSNGPWAVTNSTKLARCGEVNMWPKIAPRVRAFEPRMRRLPTPPRIPPAKARRPIPALFMT